MIHQEQFLIHYIMWNVVMLYLLLNYIVYIKLKWYFHSLLQKSEDVVVFNIPSTKWDFDAC